MVVTYFGFVNVILDSLRNERINTEITTFICIVQKLSDFTIRFSAQFKACHHFSSVLHFTNLRNNMVCNVMVNFKMKLWLIYALLFCILWGNFLTYDVNSTYNKLINLFVMFYHFFANSIDKKRPWAKNLFVWQSLKTNDLDLVKLTLWMKKLWIKKIIKNWLQYQGRKETALKIQWLFFKLQLHTSTYLVFLMTKLRAVKL